MKKLTKTYETRLETANIENIPAILDAKLEISSTNRVTDYVAFGIDNVDSQIARFKAAKTELDYLIKEAEAQKDIIKIGVSKWLADAGVEKLDGDIVSSIKITTPKAKETVKVVNEQSLINQGYFKTSLDKTAVKQAILNGENIEGAEIEITHEQPTISIYRKKKKAVSVKK